MRIILIASGEFAVPTLRSLIDPAKKHEIVCVVTQPDRGSGRGQKVTPTPVRSEAERLGLEVICTSNINEPEMVERLNGYDADVGIVIAFGQKIGQPVRKVFPQDCVNLHASLLPKYRGAAPIQWAIINGETRTGVTVFQLADRMDAGPIYVQRWTMIKPDERASELHDRLARIGVDAVRATLDIMQNDPMYELMPQDEAQATRAPKLGKTDGCIDFAEPAAQLARRICGLWSWPGARCRFQPASGAAATDVTLALARAADDEAPTEEPGTLDFRLHAATGKGHLEILEIQPSGGRLMPFQDFVNGRHVKPGDRFAPIAPA